MTIDDFDTIPNPRDGSEVWEYGDTLGFPLNQVWSLVDGDEHQWALPGYHVVNVFGHCVTRKPWTDDIEDVRWDS